MLVLKDHVYQKGDIYINGQVAHIQVYNICTIYDTKGAHRSDHLR